MGDFGFARAAFAGFDLLRRRPAATLGLALIGVLISFGGRIMSIGYVHLQVFKETAALTNTVLATVFMFIAIIATIAIIGAAVARLGARSDLRGVGLRLSGDEARLFLLTLLAFPGLLIVLLAVAIASAIGVATGLVAGPGQDALMWTAITVGAIGLFGLASRVWPAGAMTVQAGEMRLRAAWRMTRKRPWKTFAAFTLATSMALLIGLGGNIALNDAMGKLPAMRWTAYLPMVAALKSGFHPFQLGHLLLQGLIFGLGVVLQAAPATVIVGALAEDRASDQAAVFD